MRQRSFLLLVGATALIVVAAFFALVRGDLAISPPPPGGRVLPHLAGKLDQLAWMRLTRGAMKADFSQIGQRWVVVEKGNYPAASSRVRSLLLGLADLTLVEPKTRRADLLPRLDLDDPKNGKATLLTLQDRMGEMVATLIVGKSRRDLLGSGEAGVYVRRPGETQAWLARGAVDVAGDVKTWLDRRIVDIPRSRVAAVTLTAADGAKVVLRRAAPAGDFAVTDGPADAKFKDAAALAAPAAALADLQLDDVRSAVDLPVPQTGVARALYLTDDGLAVTLRLFTHDNADWAAVAASGSGKAETEAKKINARVGRWIYAVPADRAKLLRTTLGDLMAPPVKGS